MNTIIRGGFIRRKHDRFRVFLLVLCIVLVALLATTLPIYLNSAPSAIPPIEIEWTGP